MHKHWKQGKTSLAGYGPGKPKFLIYGQQSVNTQRQLQLNAGSTAVQGVCFAKNTQRITSKYGYADWRQIVLQYYGNRTSRMEWLLNDYNHRKIDWHKAI